MRQFPLRGNQEGGIITQPERKFHMAIDLPRVDDGDGGIGDLSNARVAIVRIQGRRVAFARRQTGTAKRVGIRDIEIDHRAEPGLAPRSDMNVRPTAARLTVCPSRTSATCLRSGRPY